MSNIVLIDSGYVKYSSRYICRSRCRVIPSASDHDGDIALSNVPNIRTIMYDVISATLSSKLGTINAHLAPIDSAVICLDIGKSWRAGILRTPVPGGQIASGGEYKEGRHSTDEASLAASYKLNRIYEECIDDICRYSGMVKAGSPNVESDDFMVVLSHYYASQGHNVIIVTEDADITQAVQRSDAGGNVLVFRPRHDKNAVIISPATREQFGKVSLLGGIDPLLINLQNIGDLQIVASQYVMFSKVMLGDVSDAITPVMLLEKKTQTGKTLHCKLRQADMNKVTAMLGERHNLPYMPREAIFDIDDVKATLSLSHKLLFKNDFESIEPDWQEYYMKKYWENVLMTCIDRTVMTQLWDDLTNYAKLLPLQAMHLPIPPSHVLAQVGV